MRYGRRHRVGPPERGHGGAFSSLEFVAGFLLAVPDMNHAHGQGIPRREHAAGHPPEHAAPAAEREAPEHAHAGEFGRRFWICLVLTIPVLLYSEEIQEWLGFRAPEFPGSDGIPVLFSTLIYFYGGIVFLRGAREELGARTPGMMTLVALAITVAYLYSVATLFFVLGAPLYWELSTLVVVMLLGHWIEMRAVGRAQSALADLAKLLPDTAERLTNGTVERVAVAALRPGDRVLIRPGARVPADGTVVEGESSVNEAMITGESRPVPKAPGAEVIAGTVNESGSLRAQVLKVGEETALAGIMRLVAEAHASRSRAQALADRAASWLTLLAILAGTVTLVAWLALDAPPGFALQRTVTVFVIACPHALGLAIPLVIAISTSLSARNGVLVRERVALERARDLDTILFDKTGTLTRGEQGVVGIAVNGLSEDEALALAAAVEADSEHMIARAIREAAERRDIRRPQVTGFEALPGKGVRGRVDGQEVLVGGPNLLDGLGRALPADLAQASDTWGEEGKSVVTLVVGGEPRAVFALADLIREESREAVERLRGMGIRVAMLTGDSEAVAKWVAHELGIDEYFAEVLPQHKSEKVQELRARGERVAMVGDGINDAPALLTADVGIAIGAGTDVAIRSAGIILVRDDPRDVARVVKLSRASYRKMLQNLAWATGYNVVAIPLAAGVLAGYGILLAPAMGALLMSASTVIVALNAQLLRRLNLAE
jgi:Cu2+-exporting ATPase